MPSYKAPVRDMRFIIHEVLKFEEQRERLNHEDSDAETIDAVLIEAARFNEEVAAPLNLPGDQEGCKWDDGKVTTPAGFKEAYKSFVEAGWGGLNCDPEYGGQGMPLVLSNCVSEMTSSGNMAFAMYNGLSHGVYNAVHVWGTDEQKQTWLPPLIDGSITGTMCLTEAHCGTDLGLLKTKAVPQGDDTYALTGTKIFISAGEHDLADNIVHLVLARLPDAPEGIKGISLFLVPKFQLNEDGSPGQFNNVSCASIEHKMGIKASATCVMNFDGSIGVLVGAPHKGMRAMFTMMNEARLGVATQGLSQAVVAYQNAVAYANDRIQGRSLTGAKNPDKPADPLIVHADIRRMLLTVRSFTEGARALGAYVSMQGDISHRSPDEKEREKSADIIALLTPVVKAFFTDAGFESTVLAQQVYGGHGYIGEWGAEQFVRDARIAQIYEGTNGVQALDLVGRKLAAHGGRAVRSFLGEVTKAVGAASANEDLADFTVPLQAALGSLNNATMWLAQNAMKNPDNAGAGACEYLRLFGLVAIGYMWLRMAEASEQALADGTDEERFYEAKLQVGRFFMQRWLPDHASLLAKLQAGSDVMMSLEAENF